MPLFNLSIGNVDLVEPDVEEGGVQGEDKDQQNQPEDHMPGDNLRGRLAAEVSAPGTVSLHCRSINRSGSTDNFCI